MRTRPPRVSERALQQQIVTALRTIGATVYVIGTVHAGEPGHRSTRQTPGLPDLCVHLPATISHWVTPARELLPLTAAHQLWIECKATGGRLRPEQKVFRDFCQRVGHPHLVGNLDTVLAYLQEHHYLKAEDVPWYRRPA